MTTARTARKRSSSSCRSSLANLAWCALATRRTYSAGNISTQQPWTLPTSSAGAGGPRRQARLGCATPPCCLLSLRLRRKGHPGIMAQHAPQPCVLCARTPARVCRIHLYRQMQCCGAYMRIVSEDRTPIALRSPIAHHALDDVAHGRVTDPRNDRSKHEACCINLASSSGLCRHCVRTWTEVRIRRLRGAHGRRPVTPCAPQQSSATPPLRRVKSIECHAGLVQRLTGPEWTCLG